MQNTISRTRRVSAAGQTSAPRRALALVWFAFGGELALAEPAPKSLDQALAETLNLGDADGCSGTFDIPPLPQDKLDELLVELRTKQQLGDELAAVCGSSAVNSAAALGGSLGSPQTTKTVSQFRLARRRVDSRLNLRGKRFGLGRDDVFAALDEPSVPRATDALRVPAEEGDGGLGVFAQGEHERRDRTTTALEAGYDAQISSGLLGLDYITQRGLVVGAWAGYSNASADYRRANLLVGSSTAAIDPSALSNSLTPALLADICNLGPGGDFDDAGIKLGGFLGARFGAGFVDVALQYSRRDYDYRRNVCSIEAPQGAEPIIADGTPPSGFSNDGQELDDIYAGTISGDTRLSEWSASARVGYDFGNERFLWGPRVSLTYVSSRLDAFTERGRTSVTNRVESNNSAVLFTDREPGDPTGLELAFDAQKRDSLQSELQLVAVYRFEPAFGAIIPRISASWIHEFAAERERVTVRMAQDFRAAPTRFFFTTDAADKDKGVIAVGVTALRGVRFAADAEIAHLLGDSKFDSTSVTAQARWKF